MQQTGADVRIRRHLVYGLLERALIPFGLHHVFYMPFWQTAVGGRELVNGQLIEGAQNIFFAELANLILHISVSQPHVL